MSSQNTRLQNTRVAFLGIMGLAVVLLSACNRGPSSPLDVRASISPTPIVGQEVTWHIEMVSLGNVSLPNTTLSVTLPAGVELVSGDANWHGDVPAGGTVAVDLTIRVTMPGEWAIYAYAFSQFDPNSPGGVGGGKTLYIISSADTAEVVEDVNRPTTPIPTLLIAPTNTPS